MKKIVLLVLISLSISGVRSEEGRYKMLLSCIDSFGWPFRVTVVQDDYFDLLRGLRNRVTARFIPAFQNLKKKPYPKGQFLRIGLTIVDEKVLVKGNFYGRIYNFKYNPLNVQSTVQGSHYLTDEDSVEFKVSCTNMMSK